MFEQLRLATGRVSLILLSATIALIATACATPPTSSARSELARQVDAIERPDAIVVVPCADVPAFTVPESADSLLASCFSARGGGDEGDVRVFIDQVAAEVGAGTDIQWDCEPVGVAQVFCSTQLQGLAGTTDGVRVIVHFSSDQAPLDLPISFVDDVEIAVILAPSKD